MSSTKPNIAAIAPPNPKRGINSPSKRSMYQRIKTPKMKMLEKTIPPPLNWSLCSVRELINDKIPKLIAIFLYITIHIQFIIKTKIIT